MRLRTALIAVLALVCAAGGPTGARAGGGCHAPISEVHDATLIELRNACFTPTVLHVPAGATVVWVNRDTLPHTVTGANLTWGSAGQLSEGAAVAYRFAAPGAYAFSCILHIGMLGAVVVEAPTGATRGDGSAALAAPQAVGDPVDVLSAMVHRLLRMLDGA